MERWGKFYRRSSIQVILSLSFTAVAVAGMIFLGLTLFLRFSASNNAQLAKNSQRVLAQVNLNLDAYLRGMMRVSDTMYYRVIKNADLDSDSLDAQMALLYENNRDSLVSIAVFAQSGELVSATPLATLKKSVFPQRQDWFAAAVDRIENLHFSTPHVQNLFEDPDYRYRWVVSLSRQVELTRAGSIEGGVLLVDMSFSGIEQICKDVELASSDGYLYLIDGDGEIIYHPRQQLIYAGLLEENNRTAAGYEDGSHAETFGGAKRQVTVKTVGYTGWKLVGVVPADNIWDNYGQLLLFFLFVVLFSIFLLVFVNLHLSERISVPIKTLERAVKELEAGREEVDIDVSGPYEIEHLGHSIRSMVSTMRHLMDDIIEQEAQKRRSELDVLQSQINPHFLYNTLDSVVWMTENGRTDEAILMVTSLARFFRISLSRGSNIIPIADELEHARHYLTIQKMRYKNKFSAVIAAEDGVEGLYTIKLIVQPILENAIYHGMAYADGDGEITVRARRDGGDVVIEVADNGPGMPEEMVERLLDQSYAAAPGTKGSGIGLRNVHQRIRLTFGEEYGLAIHSEPDAGTTVCIRLPVLEGPEAAAVRREGEA
ncbi:sensor histidine kinase [Intestinimonas massiliensis]|uniref:histidine kinase n=1 Tax=Intestinimonas massiliensis (ex Afouda et al. 2020) TaxID=1673721 RepID=A0ABS9M9K0_9FIRM|nr:sensor histidine kinase [Intestinimonas massiliensis (ex Afouda et al. 2020)]MCG4527453.1 sensor histidine kinase [Intestinimonas massiliensis (ex Afouda et al. 2020)]MCQ4807335.1 sensor histidine kinase [Intestinimonas massiliensis (ex Afouda et al. 2020)]